VKDAVWANSASSIRESLAHLAQIAETQISDWAPGIQNAGTTQGPSPARRAERHFDLADSRTKNEALRLE